jgi:protein-L-isoaspartate(D-aspartate) O-methyltransferase
VTDHGPAPELITAMVDALREHRNIRTAEVAEAFSSVPRHLFVPGRPLAEAYTHDFVVPTHFDADGLAISSSSAPNIMATMLEQLRAVPGMNVLEVGAGTGYNAGLLAHLVAPTGRVVSVDLDEQVAAEARAHLEAAGVEGVTVVPGDGWFGAAADAPFDRVMLTVGAWEVSPHWFAQLRPGGVLVMPLWLSPGVQVSAAFVRNDTTLSSESLVGCGFMRLRGPHAGPDANVVVPGWADRVDGATQEHEWTAAIEYATPERVAQLRDLITGPVASEPMPLPVPGWTTRLALEEPDVIALSGRGTWWHFAGGLFSPDRHSLALLDAGMIVSFGDPYCRERLRARLPELEPLALADLDVTAVPHPAGAAPDAWVLERPFFDLVVRHRSGGPVG